MKTVALWVGGLAVSLLLHAGVLVLLPMAFAADAIEDQPMPRSEMRVETQAVAQSESSAVPPPADAAAPGRTEGTNLSQGVIPQSRATAAPLDATTLAPAAPPPDAALSTAPPPAQAIASTVAPAAAVAAVTAPAAPVTAVAAPATTVAATIAPTTAVSATAAPATAVAATAAPATTVAAAPPPAAAALAVAPPAATLASTAAPAAPVLAGTPPPATSLALAAPAGDALAPAAAPTSALAQAAPSATPLPVAAPMATQITAELAFSGDGGVALDPQALATIQSFMQAGDPGSTAAEARDALEALLSQVPCSRLQAEFDPETGTIALRGHIPEEELRAPVLAALQAQVGTGIRVTDSMLILPRPQCGALAGIGAVDLPQSTDQTTNTRIVGNDAHARVFDYRGGDRLLLEMQSPDYPAYVYVDYFDADGNVLHLVPNDTVPLVLHAPQSRMVVGESADGQPALEITVGPPYGQEIAVAFAASVPLYDGLRPIAEPAGDYLVWLAARVAEARAADPAFKGEWVYFFVATRAE